MESYKITIDDKKEIDNIIRGEYDRYLKEYQSTINNIEIYNVMIDKVKDGPNEISNSFKKQLEYYINNLSYLKSKNHDGYKLYNEYYIENYSNILNDYIRQQTMKGGAVNYKGLAEKVLDSDMVETYYNSLNNREIKSIDRFLKIVAIRQDSGMGESIDRKDVRDSFFNTPVGFQKMFSVKPSKFYWRGDDVHPCDVDYESDPDYLLMQSFSNSKTYDFGDIRFPSTRIGSYGGSFSLPLYIQYGFKSIDMNFGDDEGEIMFFDVIYKCNKKFSRD